MPAAPDWAEISAAVERTLGSLPRLEAGDELRRQRRYENAAACRQRRLWQEHIGLATLPPYPFACECGRSGCSAVWPGTPDEYDVRRGDGWLVVC